MENEFDCVHVHCTYTSKVYIDVWCIHVTVHVFQLTIKEIINRRLVILFALSLEKCHNRVALQVCVKSPAVVLTICTHVGRVSVNLSCKIQIIAHLLSKIVKKKKKKIIGNSLMTLNTLHVPYMHDRPV